jgi:hypothetical protein
MRLILIIICIILSSCEQTKYKTKAVDRNLCIQQCYIGMYGYSLRNGDSNAHQHTMEFCEKFAPTDCIECLEDPYNSCKNLRYFASGFGEYR